MLLLFRLLSFTCLVKSSFPAFSACATGVTCPTGGLWSDWATSQTCPTSCGSCSTLYYTRKCLSTSADCSCSGDYSRYFPCNTQSCLFPSQKSCCDPYISMIINGSLQCGPIPRDTSSSTTSCCPSGGLWSPWSGYNLTGTTWTRTRECLSTTVACPCTGDTVQSQTSCPCPSMTSPATVHSTCNLANSYFSTYNQSIDDTTCTLSVQLTANNDVPGLKTCQPVTTYKNWDFAPYVSFYAPTQTSNTCPQDRPYYCEARKEAGENGYTLPISFTCDTKALKWRYDATGYLVDGFVELIIG